MRFQQLVYRTVPHSLVEWLDGELEKRGIDCAYTHCLLSTLQEGDDTDPDECLDVKSNQQKVYQKYGGPESLYLATKAKHQKWKTYDKNILLTSSVSCYDAGISDLERKKRCAAINLLKSVSEDNTVEALVDDLCVKLKNIKILKAPEKNDTVKCLTMIDKEVPFYIPPSSPTDQVEKYFAAFPPLDKKNEEKGDSNQVMHLNAWYTSCIKKNENMVQDIFKNNKLNSFQKSSNFKNGTHGSLVSIENIYASNKNVAKNCHKKSPSIIFPANRDNFIKSQVKVHDKNISEHEDTNSQSSPQKKIKELKSLSLDDFEKTFDCIFGEESCCDKFIKSQVHDKNISKQEDINSQSSPNKKFISCEKKKELKSLSLDDYEKTLDAIFGEESCFDKITEQNEIFRENLEVKLGSLDAYFSREKKSKLTEKNKSSLKRSTSSKSKQKLNSQAQEIDSSEAQAYDCGTFSKQAKIDKSNLIGNTNETKPANKLKKNKPPSQLQNTAAGSVKSVPNDVLYNKVKKDFEKSFQKCVEQCDAVLLKSIEKVSKSGEFNKKFKKKIASELASLMHAFIQEVEVASEDKILFDEKSEHKVTSCTPSEIKILPATSPESKILHATCSENKILSDESSENKAVQSTKSPQKTSRRRKKNKSKKNSEKSKEHDILSTDKLNKNINSENHVKCFTDANSLQHPVQAKASELVHIKDSCCIETSAKLNFGNSSVLILFENKIKGSYSDNCQISSSDFKYCQYKVNNSVYDVKKNAFYDLHDIPESWNKNVVSASFLLHSSLTNFDKKISEQDSMRMHNLRQISSGYFNTGFSRLLKGEDSSGNFNCTLSVKSAIHNEIVKINSLASIYPSVLYNISNYWRGNLKTLKYWENDTSIVDSWKINCNSMLNDYVKDTSFNLYQKAKIQKPFLERISQQVLNCNANADCNEAKNQNTTAVLKLPVLSESMPDQNFISSLGNVNLIKIGDNICSQITLNSSSQNEIFDLITTGDLNEVNGLLKKISAKIYFDFVLPQNSISDSKDCITSNFVLQNWKVDPNDNRNTNNDSNVSSLPAEKYSTHNTFLPSIQNREKFDMLPSENLHFSCTGESLESPDDQIASKDILLTNTTAKDSNAEEDTFEYFDIWNYPLFSDYAKNWDVSSNVSKCDQFNYAFNDLPLSVPKSDKSTLNAPHTPCKKDAGYNHNTKYISGPFCRKSDNEHIEILPSKADEISCSFEAFTDSNICKNFKCDRYFPSQMDYEKISDFFPSGLLESGKLVCTKRCNISASAFSLLDRFHKEPPLFFLDCQKQKMLKKVISIDRIIHKINAKTRVVFFLQSPSNFCERNAKAEFVSSDKNHFLMYEEGELFHSDCLRDSESEMFEKLKSMREFQRKVEHIWRNDESSAEDKIPSVSLPSNSRIIAGQENNEEVKDLFIGLYPVSDLREKEHLAYREEQAVCSQIYESPYKANRSSENKSLNEDYIEIPNLPVCNIVQDEVVSEISNSNKNFEFPFSVPHVDPVDVPCLDNCQRETMDSQINCSDFNYSSSMKNEAYHESDVIDLSAFRGPYGSYCETKKNYLESGSCSHDHDLYTSAFRDRCSSLKDLSTSSSEKKNLFHAQLDRLKLSEDGEIPKLSSSRWPNSSFRRHIKHKYPLSRRPCSYYMEGNCNRTDCKFSHDLSTITCRFWREGSCFKGSTCPFLHGYVDELKSFDQQHNLPSKCESELYSLDSEADFPSLSSTKCESLSKSEPIKIIQKREVKNSSRTNL